MITTQVPWLSCQYFLSLLLLLFIILKHFLFYSPHSPPHCFQFTIPIKSFSTAALLTFESDISLVVEFVLCHKECWEAFWLLPTLETNSILTSSGDNQKYLQCFLGRQKFLQLGYHCSEAVLFYFYKILGPSGASGFVVTLNKTAPWTTKSNHRFLPFWRIALIRDEMQINTPFRTTLLWMKLNLLCGRCRFQ